MTTRSTTPTRPSSTLCAALAALGLLGAAGLSACQSQTSADDGTPREASNRPVPDKGPKRPADITPPPPPVPGQTAR
ncbi:MAG TPA: hypothetical protein PKE29_06510 [Phycisphaerales bacterium]|nr:hypothetical protein [Phycisphaerales bacterium]